MNEIQSTLHSTSEVREQKEEQTQKTKNNKIFFGLEIWEIGAIFIALSLIAFVAIPNYFYALKELRGEECSSRLTMLANCLQYLADKNETKPGEKICEQFDINELLEQVQGSTMDVFTAHQGGWFYKVGAEPDCADVGDHSYSLYLGADGQIIPPTCSLGSESNQELGLHTCDMSKVTGELGIHTADSSKQ